MADDIRPRLGRDRAEAVVHQTPPLGQEEATAPGQRPRALTRRTNAMEDVAGRLERVMDLLEATSSSLSAILSRQGGQLVNNVLFAGTLPFDTNGVLSREHRVMCGSLLVINPNANAVTVHAAPPSSSAPPQGIGVHTVPGLSFLPVAIASHSWTIYGTAAQLVDVTAFAGLEAFGALG
jgi:hypothetical protein